MSDFASILGATFDAKKGRISVPAPYRQVLSRMGAEEIILRQSRHNAAIEVWPKPVYMAEVESRVAGLSKLSAEYQSIMRKLMGRIHILHPDGEGRLVMPKELADRSGLDGEIVFAGRGAYFEIWTKPAYEAEEARLDADDPGGDV